MWYINKELGLLFAYDLVWCGTIPTVWYGTIAERGISIYTALFLLRQRHGIAWYHTIPRFLKVQLQREITMASIKCSVLFFW